MINQESIDKFRLELPVFEKNIRAFEAGEIDRNTLKASPAVSEAMHRKRAATCCVCASRAVGFPKIP